MYFCKSNKKRRRATNISQNIFSFFLSFFIRALCPFPSNGSFLRKEKKDSATKNVLCLLYLRFQQASRSSGSLWFTWSLSSFRPFFFFCKRKSPCPVCLLQCAPPKNHVTE
uniref:Secreted protein n=1 Tax=Caenorhabditis tropicalis TaxID=1561998 RepID=A0A1I7TS59_9PELO